MMGESADYLYVILDTAGSCWAMIDGGTEKLAGLPALLREGWRPVRETPYSGTHTHEPYVLLLLERDTRDPKGFGFRP